MNQRLDDARAALNEYINHHRNNKRFRDQRPKKKTERWKCTCFSMIPKQLLNKLEFIGEIIAGNTSIQMRNTGVSILDTLLRMSTINKPQYNKLYKK